MARGSPACGSWLVRDGNGRFYCASLNGPDDRKCLSSCLNAYINRSGGELTATCASMKTYNI